MRDCWIPGQVLLPFFCSFYFLALGESGGKCRQEFLLRWRQAGELATAQGQQQQQEFQQKDQNGVLGGSELKFQASGDIAKSSNNGNT